MPPQPGGVAGLWEPLGGAGSACRHTYVQLRADGTWQGNTDSNLVRGRWVTGDDGLALGSAGPRAGSSCAYSAGTEPDPAATSVDSWMLRLARWGVDAAGRLVLLDPDGNRLAELVRHAEPEAAEDADGNGVPDAWDPRAARPYTPPPEDPRRQGEPVPGGVRYLGLMSEHQFDLAPLEGSTEFEWSLEPYRMLVVDGTDRAAKLLTGCAGGDLWLTVRSRTSPPPALATAMAGWEVAEEETMSIRSTLYARDIFGGWSTPVFTPDRPGLHRVRVLAKGRNLRYDASCESPVEHYDVTIWPVDLDEPRVRRGDDHLGSPTGR